MSTKYILTLICVATVYAFSGWLGQQFAIPPGNVTPFWPPSGIALAIFLLLGTRMWPGILLGAFFINTFGFINQSFSYVQLFSGMLIGLGSVLQPLFGYWLIKRFIDNDRAFERLESTLIYLAIIPLMCLVSASIGVLSLWLGEMLPANKVGLTWITWWLGDSVGVLVFTPLITTWFFSSGINKKNILQPKLILLASATLAISMLVFNAEYPVVYLLLPPLLWLALSGNFHWLTISTFLMDTTACLSTSLQSGPFYGDHLNESLLLLQLFVTVSVSTVYIVHSLTQERQRANEKLTAINNELMDAQEQLVQSAKLASLGEMTAGLAHEINQPLGGISLAEEAITDMVEGDIPLEKGEVGKCLVQINSQVDRITKIVRHLKTFSRQDVKEFSDDVDINWLIEESFVLIAASLRQNGINLVREFAADLPRVSCNYIEIEQVLTNLLVNAIDALRGIADGCIVLRSYQSDKSILVEVEDNGCGMSTSTVSRVFDPFYTTKPIAAGTGLGMSISYAIIKKHNGILSVSSTEGQGACFTMQLPL